MVVAALVISILALLLCGLLALAVMELVAGQPSDPKEPAEDSIELFEPPAAAESTVASSHGLPGWIDQTRAHVVVIISPVCATCHRLAASFEGAIPDHLTVLVTAADPVRMRKWASAQGLPLDGVVFDDDMSIVDGLGVTSSPAAVGFVDGRAAFGAHLGGRRALDDLIAQRVAMLDQDSSPVPSIDGDSQRPAAEAAKGD